MQPSNNGGREPSALLQEHKLSGKRLSSQELVGHIVEFSRDSHGSRLVQFKMETGSPEERRMFVHEALPHILSLARDLFGNYVLQNFFDHCDAEQRDEMAKLVFFAWFHSYRAWPVFCRDSALTTTITHSGLCWDPYPRCASTLMVAESCNVLSW